jgi:hypothetical protein
MGPVQTSRRRRERVLVAGVGAKGIVAVEGTTKTIGSRRRRLGGLGLALVCAALAAPLLVPRPGSAAKTCFGQEPTDFTIEYEGEVAILTGTDGDDVIIGGDENSIVYAGDGHDRICTNGGDDSIFAGPGKDLVAAGPGDDWLIGGDGKDELKGASGDDQLYGGDGADTLKGGADDDELYGEGGADSLNGGPGADGCTDGDAGSPLAPC